MLPKIAEIFPILLEILEFREKALKVLATMGP
jgi:hypothetical protein